jgi:hypothetical protein
MTQTKKLMNIDRIAKFLSKVDGDVGFAVFPDGFVGVASPLTSIQANGHQLQMVGELARFTSVGSVRPGFYRVSAALLLAALKGATEARLTQVAPGSDPDLIYNAIEFGNERGDAAAVILDQDKIVEGRDGRWGMTASPAGWTPSRTLRDHPVEGVDTFVFSARETIERDRPAAGVDMLQIVERDTMLVIRANGRGDRVLMDPVGFGSNAALMEALKACTPDAQLAAMTPTCDLEGSYQLSARKPRGKHAEAAAAPAAEAKAEEEAPAVKAEAGEAPAAQPGAAPAAQLEQPRLPMEGLPAEEAAEAAEAKKRERDDIDIAVEARDIETLKAVHEAANQAISLAVRRQRKAASGLAKVLGAIVRDVGKGTAESAKEAYQKGFEAGGKDAYQKGFEAAVSKMGELLKGGVR